MIFFVRGGACFARTIFCVLPVRQGRQTAMDAAELMLLRAAWLEDNGLDFEKEAAMAKDYASDAAMRAALEGVQIFGGNGYMKDYPAERHMRDAKICQIYEGTNEIQRIVVAWKLIGLR